ncbi:hypothetical protein D3C77_553580 [compost metagenome]
MIFTHFGLSGPIALRCSGFIRGVKKKHNLSQVTMSIDLFPDMKAGSLENDMRQLAAAEPKKALKNVFKGTIPERLLPLLFERASLPGDTTYEHLPKENWLTWVQLLKNFTLQVSGTRPFEEAFVTGGGVHLKEINPKSMESKLMPGLFFCGEILDVHGYTGGYNITAAFATGYTAGHNAGRGKRD